MNITKQLKISQSPNTDLIVHFMCLLLMSKSAYTKSVPHWLKAVFGREAMNLVDYVCCSQCYGDEDIYVALEFLLVDEKPDGNKQFSA